MAAELNTGETVLYLYGITESRALNVPVQIGVDLLSTVEPIDCEGIVCWISRVSAEDFDDNLSRNMENLDWLAEKSVAHQRAISAIAHATEILPARFGTIFRTEASLRKHIRGRVRDLKRDFERVKGADEWGVKVFSVKPAAPPAPEIRSGKDYLKAKAALLPERKSRADVSGELAEFEHALKSVAMETAAVGNISSAQRGLTFQTSLLVKRNNREKFESLLKKFSENWADARRIECTGPWPPYSFVSRPDQGARSK
jgi:gas vesicle protein GvpL/GvpF